MPIATAAFSLHQEKTEKLSTCESKSSNFAKNPLNLSLTVGTSKESRKFAAKQQMSNGLLQEACFAGLMLVEILSASVSVSQVQRVANFTRDITDMIAQEGQELTNPQDIEGFVLSHPLMRRELELHEQALQVLSNSTMDDSTLSKLEALAG